MDRQPETHLMHRQMLNTSMFRKTVHEIIKHALSYTIHEIERTRFPENEIKARFCFLLVIKRKTILSVANSFLMRFDFQCTFCTLL